MLKPIIRMARNEEGEQVRDLLLSCGLVPMGHDWSEVFPFWLVAEYKGKIVGAIQVLIGKPLGHIDFWCVAPQYQGMGFGIPLWQAAEKMLGNSNCDGFTFVSDHPAILKRLKSHGAIAFGPPVNWCFKRVFRKKAVKNEDDISETHP